MFTSPVSIIATSLLLADPSQFDSMDLRYRAIGGYISS